MTLILTVLTRKHVVQVSDRRIVTRFPNGRVDVQDDHENKAIYVISHGSNFVVSYTGRARVRGTETAEWLTGRIQVANEGFQRYDKIRDELGGPVIQHLKTLAVGACDTTIVIAGFTRLTQTGNLFEMKSFVEAVSTGNPWHKIIVSKENESIVAHGSVRAISDKSIRQIRTLSENRFFRSESGDEVADRLADILREATGDPTYGKYIGRNCMSVVVTPNPHLISYRLHIDGPAASQLQQPVVVSPNIVFGGLAIRAVAPPVADLRVQMRIDEDGPNLPPFPTKEGETRLHDVIIPGNGDPPRLEPPS